MPFHLSRKQNETSIETVSAPMQNYWGLCGMTPACSKTPTLLYTCKNGEHQPTAHFVGFVVPHFSFSSLGCFVGISHFYIQFAFARATNSIAPQKRQNAEMQRKTTSCTLPQGRVSSITKEHSPRTMDSS